MIELMFAAIINGFYMFDSSKLMKGMGGSIIKCRAFALLCLFTSISATQVCAQQEFIDEIRELASQQLGPERLGPAYAAMINFAVIPNIAAATYNIKGESDESINVFRIPLRHVFTLDDHAWRPFVQANFAYQSYTGTLSLLDSESIDAEWQTYSGSVAVGLELPISKDLKIMTVVDSGLARLESDADYNGAFSELILKPALDGLVFNGDADAWLIGASLGIDYRRPLKRADLHVHGSLNHNYFETYDSSSGLIDFDSQLTTFDINIDALIPTGMTVSAYPIAVVVMVGNTTFLGPERDALDFTYFFEGGLALDIDISANEWALQNLRLGYKGIVGEDVTGWSLILGYRF